jgi:hypothetical protein
MDELRERLLRLGMRTASDLPQPTERPTKGGQPALETLVGGEWVEVSGRRCLVVERHYPLDHAHGSRCLCDLLAIPTDEWAPFTKSRHEPALDPRQALFIDTETTGLARGSGTFAFLVGLGFYDDDGFVVRQYFMPDPADEGALLDLLAQDLNAHQGLISFNGRSFDWPIIETRYLMSRGAPPHNGEPHLDLLLPARRLWRRSLTSCALSHLEGHVLDVVREGVDVPGYLIPQLYQDYLRWGYTRPLAGVFYHNAVDVLSMVSLAAQIGAILRAPIDARGVAHRDHLALAQLYENWGRTEDAVCAYQQARTSRHREKSAEACRRLSFLLKRLGRHDEASEIWRSQLGGTEFYPYIELAKQLEHRSRDYAQAQHIITEAIAWVQASRARLGPRAAQELLADLEHRLARVERRISREQDAQGAKGTRWPSKSQA